MSVCFLCIKKKKSCERPHLKRADQFHKEKQNNIETRLISRVFPGAINLSSLAFPISFALTHKQAIYSFLRCTALRPPPNKDVNDRAS